MKSIRPFAKLYVWKMHGLFINSGMMITERLDVIWGHWLRLETLVARSKNHYERMFFAKFSRYEGFWCVNAYMDYESHAYSSDTKSTKETFMLSHLLLHSQETFFSLFSLSQKWNSVTKIGCRLGAQLSLYLLQIEKPSSLLGLQCSIWVLLSKE